MNRAQVMESREFALIVGEKVRKALTDEQVAIFLYYTHNRKEPDFAEGGRFLHEAIERAVDRIIDDLIDLEKDRAEAWADKSAIFLDAEATGQA